MHRSRGPRRSIAARGLGPPGGDATALWAAQRQGPVALPRQQKVPTSPTITHRRDGNDALSRYLKGNETKFRCLPPTQRGAPSHF